MWVRLRLFIERLRQSYWFLPAVLTLAAVVLARVLVVLDRELVAADLMFDWLPQPGADGARAILSTVAGSTITVAGVAFSVMVVALGLTASNYGPRLLPNFLRDRGNQLTLGTFVAAFAYSTVVLMSVGSGESAFVPRLAVVGSLALALASVAVLIYFLHHAADSMRVEQILETAARRLDRAIERTFPAPEEATDAAISVPVEFSIDGDPVRADAAGYVRWVNGAELVEDAERLEARLRLVVRIGDHVLPGSTLALAQPAAVDELVERVRASVVLGRAREASEDPFYGASQLVEMAVRALSPGINDPRTAVHCLERLAASLIVADRRTAPRRLLCDDEETARVLLAPLEAAELVATVFPPITVYGQADATVLTAELRIIGELLAACHGPEMRSALARQAEEVRAAAEAGLALAADQERVERQWRTLLPRLG